MISRYPLNYDVHAHIISVKYRFSVERMDDWCPIVVKCTRTESLFCNVEYLLGLRRR